MAVTSQQAYVLANLNRVVPLPNKVSTKAPRDSYELDGVECTAQIIGLAAAKLIVKHSGGGFRQRSEAKARDNRVGERQAPLPGSIDAIKATLSAPQSVRTIGTGRR